MTQAVLAIPDSDIAPVTADAVVEQSDHLKGRISEAAFTLQAVIRGWDVLMPPVDARDYDRIIKGSLTRPLAVQIKRAYRYVARNRYLVTCSQHAPKADTQKTAYAATAYDILAVHLADVDSWVFYSRSELGNRIGISFTLPEHRKNNLRRDALAHRSPDNWELIDQVAAMYSQEPLGLGQPMSDPMSDSPCISQ